MGEFVKVGDLMGTVEDVGLRSVKIRTLDRSIVTIPNGQFAKLHLENLAERDRIRLHAFDDLQVRSGDGRAAYV